MFFCSAVPISDIATFLVLGYLSFFWLGQIGVTYYRLHLHAVRLSASLPDRLWCARLGFSRRSRASRLSSIGNRVH